MLIVYVTNPLLVFKINIMVAHACSLPIVFSMHSACKHSTLSVDLDLMCENMCIILKNFKYLKFKKLICIANNNIDKRFHTVAHKYSVYLIAITQANFT